MAASTDWSRSADAYSALTDQISCLVWNPEVDYRIVNKIISFRSAEFILQMYCDSGAGRA